MLKDIRSLYIHFPFCKHLCNYCDFYKFKLNSYNQISEFQNKLLTNLHEHSHLLETNESRIVELDTLYIGGGTPSLWGQDGAEFINEVILKKYKLASGYEFTIEVDPDSWTVEEIQSWIKIGVNRFSIGVQSFSDKFLIIMDRRHRKQQIAKLLKYLNQIGANFSIDIMLGLPESEKRDVLNEIKDLIEFNPSHFSVYILKTRKNYIHQNNLPSDEYIEREYLSVCKYLEQKDFKQYEVSNFAKNDLRSRHNIKYWASSSVAALGANATGLITSDNTALRYQKKSLGDGFTFERLDEEAFLIEKVYMGLRSYLGFDFSTLNCDAVKDLFIRWSDLDYVEKIDNYHLFLSKKGYLMLDSIMGDLFLYKIV